MFCLFHDVLLLGKGGTTVYLGPATRAKPAVGGSVIGCPPALHVLKDTYDHSCY
jgi:hypothetical protein